ncbi:carbonic anhydrase family protein [Metabacillus litoralis]
MYPFFYYNGSLTTPPRTEEVKWIMFEQPIEM